MLLPLAPSDETFVWPKSASVSILRGSTKQRAWAAKIRDQKLFQLKRTSPPEVFQAGVEIFMQERSAQYWINSRTKSAIQIYEEKVGGSKT